MIRHSEFIWLSVSDFAREYNRTPQSIRDWCKSGYMIELGYSIHRDVTGHWIIGVPPHIQEIVCIDWSQYVKSPKNAKRQIDIR